MDPLTIGLIGGGLGLATGIAGQFYESESERRAREARERMEQMSGQPLEVASTPFREAQLRAMRMAEQQAGGRMPTAAELAARSATAQQQAQMMGQARGMRGMGGALAALNAQRQSAQMGQQGVMQAAQAREAAQARAMGQMMQGAQAGRSGDVSAQGLELQRRGQQLGVLGGTAFGETADPFSMASQSMFGMTPSLMGAA